MSNLASAILLIVIGIAVAAQGLFGFKNGRVRDRGDWLARAERPRWYWTFVLVYLVGGVFLIVCGVRLLPPA